MKFLESVAATLSKASKTLAPNTRGSTEMSFDPAMAGFDWNFLKLESTRKSKYQDYENMDDSWGGEVAVALDAYADTSLKQTDPEEEFMKIKTESAAVRQIIKDINTQIRLEKSIWSWFRDLFKYGDLFLEPVFNVVGDLVRVKPVAPETMFMNVDAYGVPKMFPYVQKIDDQVVAKFLPWQMNHIKLHRNAGDWYGTSSLQAARMPFKKLAPMEDSLVMQRVTRRRRYLHMIDITSISADDAKHRINEYKKEYRSKLAINPNTGNFRQDKINMRPQDDFFMGLTDKNKRAGISVLKDEEVTDITDILYFYNKVVIALKVPRNLMGINFKGLGDDRIDSLSSVFFQTSCRRGQIAMQFGLRKLYDLVLTKKGINVNEDKNEYELVLPKLSVSDDLIVARVKLIESTAARNLMQMNVVDREYVLSEIIKLPPEKVKSILKRMDKVDAELAVQNKKEPSVEPKVKGGGGDPTKNQPDISGGSALVRINPGQNKKKESFLRVEKVLSEDKEIGRLIREINELSDLDAQHELILDDVRDMYDRGEVHD